MGSLLNSFSITKLDLETPVGGNNRLDTITIFPATNTGTPTNTANPGKPLSFFQKFIPTSTYLSFIKTAPGKSDLIKRDILNSTNLDIEKSGVDGGIPYKQDKDPTIYPATITGTPTDSANPGAPSKFNQIYTSANTYLSANPIKGTGKLKSTVANTNLDIENGKPGGGIPYKQDKDPTVYPITTQKKSPTRGFYPVVGEAATKYDQVFSPQKTYLDFIKEYI